MNFETENTMLLYVDANNKETRLINKVVDLFYLINVTNDSVIVWLDDLFNFGADTIDRINIEYTNDPKTDAKYAINNLGYYSIRITGRNAKLYYSKNRTMLKFKCEDVNISCNMSIFLQPINNKNFYDLFLFKNDLMFASLNFKNGLNYDIDASIFKNNKLLKLNFNMLKIEKAYKIKSQKKTDISNVLKEFNLI